MLENLLPPSSYQAMRKEQANKLKVQAALGNGWHADITERIPHEKQLLFINSPAKRKIIRAGRRGGKTVGIAQFAVEQFRAGRRILYAAPTEDQVNTFWKEICNAFRVPTDNGILYKNETKHIIEVPRTENRIRAKTAWNADTLRGDYADLLILDEFQLMNEDTWGVVGAPMLLDNNGDAVFIYTPPSLHSRSTTKATDPRHASKLFKKAAADTSGRWAAFHFTSHENPHLPVEGLDDITQDMSKLAYDQEIMAEDKDEIAGALWTQKNIDDHRVNSYPELTRILVGVDPPGGATECGIVAVGIGKDKHLYVLTDASLRDTPEKWANAVISTYNKSLANQIIAEKNFGGDMVEHTLRSIEGGKLVSIKVVTASRGKAVRAEPVSARYEQGLVHHVGTFPQLEDEMCSWLPASGMDSPNRMDALVWAATELLPALGASFNRTPAVNLYRRREVNI